MGCGVSKVSVATLDGYEPRHRNTGSCDAECEVEQLKSDVVSTSPIRRSSLPLFDGLSSMGLRVRMGPTIWVFATHRNRQSSVFFAPSARESPVAQQWLQKHQRAMTDALASELARAVQRDGTLSTKKALFQSSRRLYDDPSAPKGPAILEPLGREVCVISATGRMLDAVAPPRMQVYAHGVSAQIARTNETSLALEEAIKLHPPGEGRARLEYSHQVHADTLVELMRPSVLKTVAKLTIEESDPTRGAGDLSRARSPLLSCFRGSSAAHARMMQPAITQDIAQVVPLGIPKLIEKPNEHIPPHASKQSTSNLEPPHSREQSEYDPPDTTIDTLPAHSSGFEYRYTRSRRPRDSRNPAKMLALPEGLQSGEAARRRLEPTQNTNGENNAEDGRAPGLQSQQNHLPVGSLGTAHIAGLRLQYRGLPPVEEAQLESSSGSRTIEKVGRNGETFPASTPMPARGMGLAESTTKQHSPAVPPVNSPELPGQQVQSPLALARIDPLRQMQAQKQDTLSSRAARSEHASRSGERQHDQDTRKPSSARLSGRGLVQRPERPTITATRRRVDNTLRVSREFSGSMRAISSIAIDRQDSSQLNQQGTRSLGAEGEQVPSTGEASGHAVSEISTSQQQSSPEHHRWAGHSAKGAPDAGSSCGPKYSSDGVLPADPIPGVKASTSTSVDADADANDNSLGSSSNRTDTPKTDHQQSWLGSEVDKVAKRRVGPDGITIGIVHATLERYHPVEILLPEGEMLQPWEQESEHLLQLETRDRAMAGPAAPAGNTTHAQVGLTSTDARLVVLSPLFVVRTPGVIWPQLMRRAAFLSRMKKFLGVSSFAVVRLELDAQGKIL